MFRVKVCGVRSAEQIPALAAAGVDALGLNFYPLAKRFVSPTDAPNVAAAIPAGVLRIGVFVNPAVEELLAAINNCKLDAVQLHGDESPTECARLIAAARTIRPALRWIKAHRLQGDAAVELPALLASLHTATAIPDALLVDAYSPTAYGGTGHTTDWSGLGAWTTRQGIPLILAGGLTPANVAAAIHAARPDGVDTAGGVERSPGDKDSDLTRAFVANAQAAWNAIS